MNQEPRESRAAESYPTFWDDATPAPTATLTVRPEEAYSAFVSLTEGELPDGRVAAADAE